MGNCFHLHCQTWGWDHTGCSLHGWWSHLAWQWSPTLTGLWWMSHKCTLCNLAVSCFFLLLLFFLKGKLDLWLRFACLPFSTVLSHVFWQECLRETPESVWVPFQILGLLELYQLAYLKFWVLCLSYPRLAPSQSASLCVFHGFMEWVNCGDFLRHWSMLWPAPISAWFALVRGLAWTSWSQWLCLWWFPVWPALPRSALCPASADLSVPLLWGPQLTLFNALCSHSLQDWQIFLAHQCCCFQVISVGQHSMAVDFKIFQMTCSFDYMSVKCDRWHRFACCSVVKSAPQCLCLNCLDWW